MAEYRIFLFILGGIIFSLLLLIAMIEKSAENRTKKKYEAEILKYKYLLQESKSNINPKMDIDIK